MTTCWPWSAGWAGGTSRKCGCSCCAMTTRCAIRCSGGSSRWKAAARSRWPTSTSSRARNSTGTTRSCCWPTKARWSGARLPGGAQPGFLRLSRRLVLARVCVPGAHARRNGGGPAAAAPVPGFVDHRHCLAGRQAAGGPAQARPARRRALRASLRRRFRGRRRRRCRCCACWRRWARGPRSSPTRWRRRWLWAWGIRMPTCSGRR